MYTVPTVHGPYCIRSLLYTVPTVYGPYCTRSLLFVSTNKQLCLNPHRLLELNVHPDVPATDQLAGHSSAGFVGVRAELALEIAFALHAWTFNILS